MKRSIERSHRIYFSWSNFTINQNYVSIKGKVWTYIIWNNWKAYVDHIFISKKWINNALKGEAYSSFEIVSSNYRVVFGNIRLNLFRNKKQTDKDSWNDWSSIVNKQLLQETSLILVWRYLKHILRMTNMKIM